jgi:hypothetical protein
VHAQIYSPKVCIHSPFLHGFDRQALILSLKKDKIKIRIKKDKKKNKKKDKKKNCAARFGSEKLISVNIYV